MKSPWTHHEITIFGWVPVQLQFPAEDQPNFTAGVIYWKTTVGAAISYGIHVISMVS